MTSLDTVLRTLDEVLYYQIFGAATLLLMLISALATWLARRERVRRDPDRITFIDWHTISFLTFFGAFFTLMGFLKTWGNGV